MNWCGRRPWSLTFSNEVGLKKKKKRCCYPPKLLCCSRKKATVHVDMSKTLSLECTALKPFSRFCRHHANVSPTDNFRALHSLNFYHNDVGRFCYSHSATTVHFLRLTILSKLKNYYHLLHFYRTTRHVSDIIYCSFSPT